MELVYLWVEEYKNIHRQGFNFSPRFRCDFKDEYNEDGNLKDNCELVICDKKKNECEDNDHIENFFGDNINVTAVVGKNGSGKSSILDFFHVVEERKRFIIVFRTQEIVCYYANFKIRTTLRKKHIKGILKPYIYSNTDIETSDRVYLDKKNIVKMIMNNYSEKVNFKISTFMFLPVRIEIKVIDFQEKVNQEISDFIYSLGKGSGYPGYPSEEKLNKIYEIKDSFHLFLILLDGIVTDIDILLDKERLTFLYHEKISEVDYNKYFLTKEVMSLKIESMTEKEKEIYFTFSDFFEFDFLDINNIKFNNLSHGEKTLYGQLINIFYYSRKNKDEIVILLFDEPELSLHPNWQSKYLQEICLLLSSLNNRFHFIFTTHSPHLLSDIPKQNIIFLDKYQREDKEVRNKKQKIGNCKILECDKVFLKMQTFGSNIHTLLSDSFFMADGLMGEFAKSKINEIIEFHDKVVLESEKQIPNYSLLKTEYEENKTKFWQTQSIIGEEYLKQVIKNHLVDIESTLYGVSIAKKEEAERLRKEADRLDPQDG